MIMPCCFNKYTIPIHSNFLMCVYVCVNDGAIYVKKVIVIIKIIMSWQRTQSISSAYRISCILSNLFVFFFYLVVNTLMLGMRFFSLSKYYHINTVIHNSFSFSIRFRCWSHSCMICVNLSYNTIQYNITLTVYWVVK